jgi:uncharacterized protein YjiS (DUF1127 family)
LRLPALTGGGESCDLTPARKKETTMTYHTPSTGIGLDRDEFRNTGFFHRRILAPLMDWQRRRAEFVALDSLSDAILDDIGLTRAGIRDFVDGISHPDESVTDHWTQARTSDDERNEVRRAR